MQSPHLPKASRNPWPIAIIAYFIVFISGIVAFTVYASRQKVELVRADYYADEIQFQQQLDRVQRTQPVSAQISITYDQGREALTVTLPQAHAQHSLSGRIHLYRPSEAALDQQLDLAVDAQGKQQVDAKKLRPGLWKVRVQWTVEGQDYFYAQSVVVAEKESKAQSPRSKV